MARHLGEQGKMLGILAKRPCEPLNRCYILCQLRAKRSSGKFRPKSFFALKGKKQAQRAISMLRFLSKNAHPIAKKLNITYGIKRPEGLEVSEANTREFRRALEILGNPENFRDGEEEFGKTSATKFSV